MCQRVQIETDLLHARKLMAAAAQPGTRMQMLDRLLPVAIQILSSYHRMHQAGKQQQQQQQQQQ
jgi:hypothetical protein